jgi:hypothetical protein
MKSTISVLKKNLKMSEVPVTAISHHPQKFPYFSLKLCSAIGGKFRAFVRGFPFRGVRGGLRCCVLDEMDYGIRGFGGVKRRADRGIRGLR